MVSFNLAAQLLRQQSFCAEQQLPRLLEFGPFHVLCVDNSDRLAGGRQGEHEAGSEREKKWNQQQACLKKKNSPTALVTKMKKKKENVMFPFKQSSVITPCYSPALPLLSTFSYAGRACGLLFMAALSSILHWDVCVKSVMSGWRQGRAVRAKQSGPCACLWWGVAWWKRTC